MSSVALSHSESEFAVSVGECADRAWAGREVAVAAKTRSSAADGGWDHQHSGAHMLRHSG
jgi:hypothetical protein